MNNLNRAFYFVILFTQIACAPRWALIRPIINIRVKDSANRNIQDASLKYWLGSNPHEVLQMSCETRSDNKGYLKLDSKRSFEIDFYVLPHGITYYYQCYCLEKEGYIPLVWNKYDYDNLVNSKEVILTKSEKRISAKKFSKNKIIMDATC